MPGLTSTGAALVAAQLGDDAVLTTSRIIEFLAGMSQSKRIAFLQCLSDYYCIHCGRKQPPGDCQCQPNLWRP